MPGELFFSETAGPHEEGYVRLIQNPHPASRPDEMFSPSFDARQPFEIASGRVIGGWLMLELQPATSREIAVAEVERQNGRKTNRYVFVPPSWPHPMMFVRKGDDD